MKFISILPHNLRQKILENNITSYAEATQAAQRYQDIASTSGAVCNNITQSNELQIVTNELKLLKEQLNSLTAQGSGGQNFQKHTYDKNSQYRSSGRNFKAPRGRQYTRPQPITCHYCKRPGHVIKNCFRKKNNEGQNNFQDRSRTFYKSKPKYDPPQKN